MTLSEMKREILCLPLLAVWFYLLCLFWHAHQHVPQT
jgi:hypothetical protein